jgi:hypothetical protein
MRKFVAILACSSLVMSGCASAGRTPVTVAPQQTAAGAKTMADYVQRLAPGSKVRVERTDGQVVHGTLMQAGGDTIVVQTNTRVPEPPVSMPVAQLSRVTVESGGASVGKAVGIGIASGVGAFFAILAIAFAAGGN